MKNLFEQQIEDDNLLRELEEAGRESLEAHHCQQQVLRQIFRAEKLSNKTRGF